MERLKTIVLLALILFVGMNAQAVTITTGDGNGADTFVGNDSNKSPNNNYGSSTGIDIRYLPSTRAHTGYIRFDLSSITSGDLTGAMLQFDLYQSSTTSTQTWSFYGLTDDTTDDAWDEMTVTYNNIPGLLPTDPEANGEYDIDETKMTLLGTLTVPGGTAMLTTNTTDLNLDSFLAADTNGLVTLAIIDENGSGKQWYVATKEYAASDVNRTAPTLILPNAVPEPATLVLLGIGGLVLRRKRS